jgi:hypothetical protein
MCTWIVLALGCMLPRGSNLNLRVTRFLLNKQALRYQHKTEMAPELERIDFSNKGWCWIFYPAEPIKKLQSSVKGIP